MDCVTLSRAFVVQYMLIERVSEDLDETWIRHWSKHLNEHRNDHLTEHLNEWENTHLLRLVLGGYGEADTRGGAPAAVELGVQVGLEPVLPRAGGLSLAVLGPLHLLGKAACKTMLHSVELMKTFVITVITLEGCFYGYKSSF